MKQNDTFIIALSGPSGSGKTEVLKLLVNAIADSDSIRFDDYDHLHQWPSDVKAWVKNGVDLSQFRSPQFFLDLAELKRGGQVQNPFSHRTVGPAKVLVVETFFGRNQPDLARLVDFVVCLSIPLEVCIARRILRDIKGIATQDQKESGKIDHKRIVEHVESYCSRYLEYTRDYYFRCCSTAAAQCDLELTEIEAPQEYLREVKAALGNRVRWKATQQVATLPDKE
jgi:dephospho-CoA kinase